MFLTVMKILLSLCLKNMWNCNDNDLCHLRLNPRQILRRRASPFLSWYDLGVVYNSRNSRLCLIFQKSRDLVFFFFCCCFVFNFSLERLRTATHYIFHNFLALLRFLFSLSLLFKFFWNKFLTSFYFSPSRLVSFVIFIFELMHLIAKLFSCLYFKKIWDYLFSIYIFFCLGKWL